MVLTEQHLMQTNLHNATKLKKIIQDGKDHVVESDLRLRIQPLKELVASTIDQLHAVFDTSVFINICRGFWDRTGQVGSFFKSIFIIHIISHH